MKKVIDENKIPIKLWLEDMEQGALDQAFNLANLPFAFRHVAIMPDSHQGYGMPIGGVLATDKMIIPNAVGVDIGCGMCAVRTTLTEIDTDKLKSIMGEIRRVIPVGFKKHKESQGSELMPSPRDEALEIVVREYENALKSLGTLGGGNHFIEIQKGNDGFIWIMIHSGSRNFGLKVASHYNKLAIELNEKWGVAVPKEWQLAYLPLDSDEGQSYATEMSYCVDYAFANRKLMMKRVKEIFSDKLGAKFDEMINIAHNYATLENHFGKNVWIHRKGATSARDGEIGIIPGSQGTKSYIIEGKGERESFTSCSHGAGRKMSRTKAKQELDLEEEVKKMNDKGIIHGMRSTGDLDEASSAYKDIDVVMANQEDLVDIIVELEPLAVIKG